ncbi:MAG: hypothetical protein AB7P01_17595 [Bacteroidia bacterium]
MLLQFDVYCQNGASLSPADRKYQFIPALGIGAGFSKFTGDITDISKTNVHWLGNKFAYDATFSMNLSKSFYVNVNALFGKLSGNENSKGWNRNFESSMMNFGLNLEYSFGGLYKKKRPFLTPYLSAGIYYGSYSVNTDLFDENGKLYYYWSDGKIRNVAEDAPDADNAQRLARDYDYETKLSQVSAFSVPVGGGFDFHVGKRLVFRLNTKYFFALSDKLDAFDAKPASEYNDGFFYSSVSVFFNLVPDKSNYLTKEELLELDAEDYDSDGVPDVDDECGGTKQGITVNMNGCPVDTDNDAIPDYLDSEPNSPTTAVGNDGVVFDFLKIAQNAEDSMSILHALIKKYPNLLIKSGDQKFTVYAGTFNSSSYAQKLFLQSIPGIKETQINDTLFVYSVGTYSQFEDAVQKTNELKMKGINHAFEVPRENLNEVAGDLEKVLKDTIETPEAKKVREEKYLAQIAANSKPAANEGKYTPVSAIHSEEKHDFDEKLVAEVKEEVKHLAAVAKEEKSEQEIKPVKEVVEEKTAPVAVIEEKTAEPKEVKIEKPQAVVKFSVDVVEHSDKPLPFAVLLLMQRETLTMQTVRVMGAKIFTVGNYKSVEDAQKIKAEIQSLGVNDATIIGSINSIKVTQKEAEEMLKKIGQ